MCFHIRNDGFHKNGFVVSYHRTAGTWKPEYSVELRESSHNTDFSLLSVLVHIYVQGQIKARNPYYGWIPVVLLNIPASMSLLSGDRKPQIRFYGNRHSGYGNTLTYIL